MSRCESSVGCQAFQSRSIYPSPGHTAPRRNNPVLLPLPAPCPSVAASPCDRRTACGPCCLSPSTFHSQDHIAPRSWWQHRDHSFSPPPAPCLSAAASPRQRCVHHPCCYVRSTFPSPVATARRRVPAT